MLYNMSRSKLKKEEKKLFKLPKEVCKRKGIEAMKLWIEMTEMVFQQSMKRDERKRITWFFPRKHIDDG